MAQIAIDTPKYLIELLDNVDFSKVTNPQYDS